MIKKTARIGGTDRQDGFRREDLLRMSPAQRISLLIEMRDRIHPGEPLKRVASVRTRD